jgi:hypothetical protein
VPCYHVAPFNDNVKYDVDQVENNGLAEGTKKKGKGREEKLIII